MPAFSNAWAAVSALMSTAIRAFMPGICWA